MPPLGDLFHFLCASKAGTPRRLLIIIGAGVEDDHDPNLREMLVPPEVHRSFYANSSEQITSGYHAFPHNPEHDIDSHVWDMFELARIASLLLPPATVIYAVRELVQEHRVAGIISLNYTLYVDRALEADGSIVVDRNPVLVDPQFDAERYYTNLQRPGPLPSHPSSAIRVPLYTPHGSLGFVSFAGCPPLEVLRKKGKAPVWTAPHIFRLPPFPVSTRTKVPSGFMNLRFDKTKLKRQLHVPTCVYRGVSPIRADERHDTGSLEHHIDWNDPGGSRRPRFLPEIEGSRKAITQAAKDDGCGILLLGFTAHLERETNPQAWVEHNEELAKTLSHLIRTDRVKRRVWAVVSKRQTDKLDKGKKRGKGVLLRLQQAGRLRVLASAAEWLEFAEELLIASGRPRGLGQRYKKWKEVWYRDKTD
jgi:hypothetical protein